MPTIRAPDGSRYELSRGSNRDEDVCQMVVRTAVKFFRNLPQPSRRGGPRGRRYRYYIVTFVIQFSLLYSHILLGVTFCMLFCCLDMY
jgi:hypothetical protein